MKSQACAIRCSAPSAMSDLRIFSISDCRFRIADCGLRILMKPTIAKSQIQKLKIRNPRSPIRAHYQIPLVTKIESVVPNSPLRRKFRRRARRKSHWAPVHGMAETEREGVQAQAAKGIHSAAVSPVSDDR